MKLEKMWLNNENYEILFLQLDTSPAKIMYYHIQLFIEVFGDIAALGLNLYNNKHNIVFNFILLVIQLFFEIVRYYILNSPLNVFKIFF